MNKRWFKHAKPAIFTLVVLMLAAFSANAQGTAVLFGKVLDSKSGKPLSGAVVSVSPVMVTATTNDQGGFTTGNLQAGRYYVTASHNGYDLQEVTVNLEDGERKQVDLYLNPAPNMLKMVIVKEKYVRDMPYIQHILTKDEIEMMAVRDIGDQLRMLPNVGGVKKGAVNIDPVVRGFKYSQLTILLDGAVSIEGGCPNRMDPTTSHIALDDMAEMQVLKGPFALRYGSVFGGVVNLVPVKPMASDFFEVKVKGIKAFESNWNGNREYVQVAGGNKKVYFLLSGYNQKFGDYTDGNGTLQNTDYRKFGYKAALAFRPFKKHEAMISWSNSMSKGVMFPTLPMDDRNDDSRVLSFDYKVGKINKVINSLDLKLYTTMVDHTMDNKQKPLSDTTAAVSNIIAEVMGARVEAGLTVLGGHLYVGLDQKTITKDGDRIKYMIAQLPTNGKVVARTEQLWNEAEITNLGFFAEYKRRIHNLDLIGAVRYDMNNGQSDTILLTSLPKPGIPSVPIINITETQSSLSGVSASAGATWNFNEKLSVSLAAGRGTRFPDMLERFIVALPVGYDNFEYMGNPQLEPEVNNEVDINVKFTHPNLGGMDFTIFYSYVQNFIMGKRLSFAEQKPLTDNVWGVKRFENFESAIFKGFELALKTPEKYPWGVSIIAAYTQGIVHNTLKPIIDPTQLPNQSVTGEEIVPNDPAPEIPPFEMNFSARYKFFNNRLIPSVTYRWVAAQNNVSEAYFESETPSFNIIGVNLAYKHNQYLTISTGVNNLLDTPYYEHLNRRIIGSKAIFYEPGRVIYVNAIINL